MDPRLAATLQALSAVVIAIFVALAFFTGWGV